MATFRQPSPRLAWIDQLRTLAIVLVVNMHACVTYGHVGSWYVQEDPEPPLGTRIIFVFWQGHLQAFFMGLLFFVGGYFAHGSLGRRGPAAFVRERLWRLGIPTLFYMLVLHPLMVFGLNPWHSDFGPLGPAYLHFIASGRFLGSSGPMWFAAALLVFCVVLAAQRARRPAPDRPVAAPRVGELWFWGGVAVAATFLIRVVQPLGTSVLNMQLCYFPQYVLAFGAGVAAARGGWLEALAVSARARWAGWLGLVLGPLALATVLFAGGLLQGQPFDSFRGGFGIRSLGLCAWEQLAGLGLGLGALSFCARRLDRSTPAWQWLSARSFGVYLFHPVVLIILTLGLRKVGFTNPFLNTALLTASGLAASFAVADLARRVPGIRTFL